MRCLINYARKHRGLRPLPANRALARSAAIKAERVLACNDYAHRPCGDDLMRSFVRAGYRRPGHPIAAEEDINWGNGADGTRYGDDESARATMRAWLASPPHRAAIFGRHCEQGIARQVGALDGERGVVWVAQFGCRR